MTAAPATPGMEALAEAARLERARISRWTSREQEQRDEVLAIARRRAEVAIVAGEPFPAPDQTKQGARPR